uniref:Lipocalin n=1 Tax=Rhipicephalus zambeziensis TaxID=60191 RepID=A0A224YMX2_9ACAR
MLSAFVLALVLAVSRSTAESATAVRGVPGNHDITKFFDQKDPSWTYKTTKRTTYLCVVDVTYNRTEHNVNYEKYSRLNNRTLMTPLRGNLKHWPMQSSTLKQPYNALDVYDEDGEKWWTEKLEYSDADSKCGVIAVMIPRNTRTIISYDLRLKNSTVDGHPDKDCSEIFEKFSVKATVTQLYTEDCQKMLKNIRNTLAHTIS